MNSITSDVISERPASFVHCHCGPSAARAIAKPLRFNKLAMQPSDALFVPGWRMTRGRRRLRFDCGKAGFAPPSIQSISPATMHCENLGARRRELQSCGEILPPNVVAAYEKRGRITCTTKAAYRDVKSAAA